MPDAPRVVTGPDGNAMAYRQFGNGPRLITCLHSLALDGSWYEPLARALGEDYRLLAPDFRGHGASERGEAPITLDRIAADVAAVWDAEGIERSVVLGISLGGVMAQAVTGSLASRVEAQILVATRGAYDEAAAAATTARADDLRALDGVERAEKSMLQRWFGDGASNGSDPLVRRAREQFLGSDGNIVADYLIAMTRVGEFRTESPPRTLVVGGDDDRSTPRAVTEQLAASIPGAELRLAHGGHLVAFDDPNEVAATIRPFLDRLECWAG
ncbi:alpha/beta fold hydrolase [Saccharopolyspora shandongensis]|uniref:alpha/beta fold hydrolase n=1 Tax=Saccharopolyspora shandongensis TaxID=418495 RepID=UPI0033CC4CA8